MICTLIDKRHGAHMTFSGREEFCRICRYYTERFFVSIRSVGYNTYEVDWKGKLNTNIPIP